MSLLKLFIILFVKAFFLAVVVQVAGIGLAPDEAQYWTWSEHLSLGYYSKPPGIAWQIAAGTALLGNTEEGVRLFAQVIGFLFPVFIYFSARIAHLTSEQSYLAALIAALAPLGWLASLLSITDGGLVIFWTLALATLFKPQKENVPPSYTTIGILIACGALFKWPIYWFWLFLMPALLFIPRLRSSQIFTGISISLLGLLPSLFWNLTHNFATFRHVGAAIITKNTPDIGATMLAKGNFWDFFGAQAMLLSPILFLLLFGAIWALLKNWKTVSEGIKICFFFSILPLLLFLTVAYFKKMQGNWCEFAYPAAIILIAWYASEKWIKIGLALSCFLTLIIFAIPALQKNGIPIPYKFNAFKHNMGWDNLSAALQKTNYDPETEFLFADKYQTTAVLSFYGPLQKQAFFFNLHGIRLNQFSFWPGMDKLALHKTGYFVIVENEPHLSRQWDSLLEKTPELLSLYFKKIEFLEAAPLFGESKKALIWKCEEYNGELPTESTLY